MYVLIEDKGGYQECGFYVTEIPNCKNTSYRNIIISSSISRVASPPTILGRQ